MASKVKTAKNSKLPKLPENYFEQVGKGWWPPISTWINEAIGSAQEGVHSIKSSGSHTTIINLDI
jgi:hypothetical protein